LRSFRLHSVLFDFAVKRVSVEMGVVFFLFETSRSARAFFVARRDVAGWGFALGSRFSALECDVFLCHN
jgi:hypothetical protein